MSIDLFKLIELFLIALVISFVASQGGISGAYLLLPIQSYILGTTNPVITSTNLMYNLVSIPLSIYKYVREKRIAASFTLVLVIGSSISAALGGAWLRGHYLTSKYVFSYFMGTLLLVLAVELVLSSLLIKEVHTYEAVIRCNRNKSSLIITTTGGSTYRVRIPLLVIVTVLVGIVSSAYGIGGAPILSPILMGPMGLSAYVVSGPTLIVTFIVSIIGTTLYTYIGYPPDMVNGIFMGLGGMVGIYLGTITQRRFPERYIKLMIASITAIMGLYSIPYVSRI